MKNIDIHDKHGVSRTMVIRTTGEVGRLFSYGIFEKHMVTITNNNPRVNNPKQRSKRTTTGPMLNLNKCRT